MKSAFVNMVWIDDAYLAQYAQSDILVALRSLPAPECRQLATSALIPTRGVHRLEDQ
jgi:hypothetical protein